jgi:hypothetical protein
LLRQKQSAGFILATLRISFLTAIPTRRYFLNHPFPRQKPAMKVAFVSFAAAAYGAVCVNAFAPFVPRSVVAEKKNGTTNARFVLVMAGGIAVRFLTIPQIVLLFAPFSSSALFMAENKTPFFAAGPAAEKAKVDETDVDAMTNAELKKMRLASRLRDAKGNDYAPWMNISKEDEMKIKQVMADKAVARRKRQEQATKVSGALLNDSQAQELSGGGLKTKCFDQQVELEWATSSEISTEGFIVKRRPARTEDFTVIASYEDWGPLASKGEEGGVYRFLDDTVSPGSWVYRVTERDTSGRENDVCQALVDLQTAEEQRGAIIAGVGIAVIGLAAVAAGIFLDPVGGY